jgi:hypothetical protein
VIQDYTVREDYRGIGLGLCLLDDACRRICDREAWVLVALPQPCFRLSLDTTEASLSCNNTNKSPAAASSHKRRFSLGRAPWPAMILSAPTRDKQSSTRHDETEASSSEQAQPQQSDPEDTLLSYLGLLGFGRLTTDSPFCVRWNKGDHLPTIEDICPHVPIFHPSPSASPPPQQVGEAQHSSSPSPS